MCGKKSIFIELGESVNGNVTFGDDFKVQMKGKGNVLIRLKDGFILEPKLGVSW